MVHLAVRLLISAEKTKTRQDMRPDDSGTIMNIVEIMWVMMLMFNNLRDSVTQSRGDNFHFMRAGNAGHCHITMTSVNLNDFCVWRILLVKRQTGARYVPHTREFIILRDDRHAWTDRNSLTGKERKWVRNKFIKVFLHKITFNMFKMH